MLDTVHFPRALIVSAARLDHRHDNLTGHRAWAWAATLDPTGRRLGGNFSKVAVAPSEIQRAAENGRAPAHLDTRAVVLVHKGRAKRPDGAEFELASGVGLAGGDIYVTLATQLTGDETLIEPLEIHVEATEPLPNEVAPLANSYHGPKRSS